MATKPQLGLHEKALKAFGVIVRTKKEEKAHEVDRYFFARRKEEEVNHIKPLLEEMQTAFERGEEIGGCRSLKSYCKAWKWSGVLSYARCRQILTGKSGNESKDKSVKSLDLEVKLGSILRFGTRRYTVVGLGDSMITDDKEDEYGVFHYSKVIGEKDAEATFALKEIGADPLPVAPAPKKRAKRWVRTARQKAISAAIRDANTDGNSSRAMKAMAAEIGVEPLKTSAQLDREQRVAKKKTLTVVVNQMQAAEECRTALDQIEEIEERV
jgi:hypothetical protein